MLKKELTVWALTLVVMAGCAPVPTTMSPMVTKVNASDALASTSDASTGPDGIKKLRIWPSNFDEVVAEQEGRTYFPGVMASEWYASGAGPDFYGPWKDPSIIQKSWLWKDIASLSQEEMRKAGIRPSDLPAIQQELGHVLTTAKVGAVGYGKELGPYPSFGAGLIKDGVKIFMVNDVKDNKNEAITFYKYFTDDDILRWRSAGAARFERMTGVHVSFVNTIGEANIACHIKLHRTEALADAWTFERAVLSLPGDRPHFESRQKMINVYLFEDRFVYGDVLQESRFEQLFDTTLAHELFHKLVYNNGHNNLKDSLMMGDGWGYEETATPVIGDGSTVQRFALKRKLLPEQEDPAGLLARAIKAVVEKVAAPPPPLTEK